MRIVFVTQCFKVRDIPWFLIRFETMEQALSILLLRLAMISKNEVGRPYGSDMNQSWVNSFIISLLQ